MRRSFLLRLFFVCYYSRGPNFSLCRVRRMAVVASASDFFLLVFALFCVKNSEKTLYV